MKMLTPQIQKLNEHQAEETRRRLTSYLKPVMKENLKRSQIKKINAQRSKNKKMSDFLLETVQSRRPWSNILKY